MHFKILYAICQPFCPGLNIMIPNKKFLYPVAVYCFHTRQECSRTGDLWLYWLCSPTENWRLRALLHWKETTSASTFRSQVGIWQITCRHAILKRQFHLVLLNVTGLILALRAANVVTKQRHLSLDGRKPRISPVVQSDFLLIFPSDECHRTLLMIGHHWFR